MGGIKNSYSSDSEHRAFQDYDGKSITELSMFADCDICCPRGDRSDNSMWCITLLPGDASLRDACYHQSKIVKNDNQSRE